MKRKNSTLAGITLLLLSTGCLIYFQYHNSSPLFKRGTSNNVIPVEFPSPYEYYPAKQKSKKREKFLSYLPHSGFHNQRIELENALLLAKYLNRTLLVPPVYLSNPAMPWLRYERLHERLLFQTKNGLDHCIKLDEQQLPLPSECLNNFRWSNIPWTFFYDLKPLDQPLIFRPTLSYQWLYQEFNLNSNDIYFFKDMHPYEYQIYDDRELNLPLDRFNYRMDISQLQQVEHPVLHFGSMFGSYRVLAETESHMEDLRTIRANMIFQNPVLSKATENIVNQLGGANQFVGMHIRVGDGIFKLRASILVDDIYHELVDKYTDLTEEQVAYYEGGQAQHDEDRTESTEYEIKLRSFHPVDETNYTKPIEVHHQSTADFQYSTQKFGKTPHIASRLRCAKGDRVTERFKNTVLYIATDTPDPRNHPLLKKLFNVFPCSFILDDFKNEIEDIKKLQVVEERVKLESYLIPMVDAMISAHGHTFFGTPHSTFTSYIERQLHPYYTGKQVQVMGLLDYLDSQ